MSSNLFIYLKSKMDADGNKRQIYLLYVDGVPQQAWETIEEYERFCYINSTPQIDIFKCEKYPIYISPSEYKRFRKLYIKSE